MKENLPDIQQAVDGWIKNHGGYYDIPVNISRLLEESGELTSVILRNRGILRAKPSDAISRENLENEFGDVLFVLCCLANQMDIDLTKALASSLKKFNDRKN